MRDVVRFWGRIPIVLAVIISIIYWSVRRDGLDHGAALAYSVVGTSAIAALLFLVQVGAGVFGGWSVRRRALRKTGRDGTALFAVTSSEDLQHHVRQLDGVGPLFQMPWGLTLVVSDTGLGVWVERRQPHELLHFTWAMVHSVQPERSRTRSYGNRCLNVEIVTPAGLLPLRFPLLAGAALVPYPAGPHGVTEAARRIRNSRPIVATTSE